MAVRGDVPIRDPRTGYAVGTRDVLYPLKDVILHPEGHEYAGTVARWPKGNPQTYAARISNVKEDGRRWAESLQRILNKTLRLDKKKAGIASGMSRSIKAATREETALAEFNGQVNTGVARHVAVGRAAKASGLSKARVNQLIAKSKTKTNKGH